MAATGTPAGERLVAEAAGALSRSMTRSSRSESCMLKSLSDCGGDDSQLDAALDAGLTTPAVAVAVAAFVGGSTQLASHAETACALESSANCPIGIGFGFGIGI